MIAEDAVERAEDLRAHIGWNVRQWRRRLGWRQADLAERAGLHQTAVSGVELGEDCKVSTVARLAVALGVTIPELCRRPKEYADFPTFDQATP